MIRLALLRDVLLLIAVVLCYVLAAIAFGAAHDRRGLCYTALALGITIWFVWGDGAPFWREP